jgi:hypothetical protein
LCFLAAHHQPVATAFPPSSRAARNLHFLLLIDLRRYSERSEESIFALPLFLFRVFRFPGGRIQPVIIFSFPLFLPSSTFNFAEAASLSGRHLLF